MSQKIKNVLLQVLPVTIITTFLAMAIIYAWTEPTASPPGGNVAAPINVSSSSQYKSGALGIGGVLRGYSNAIFDGNVGIGTTDPGTARLKVSGGPLDMSDQKITNLAAPTASTDAATKAYVDAASGVPKYYQTTSTYNGAHASTACINGYHMCIAAEWFGRKYDTTLGNDGTLDDVTWYDTNTNAVAKEFGDCKNWSSESVNDSGCVTKINYMTDTGWQRVYWPCHTKHRVLCCSD